MLIEIHREDIESLPRLLHLLADSGRRCLLFCDDLSFDAGETSYKSLKAVLEGGIEGRPGNVLFYATSNRRHLMPRQMIDNERSTAIHPGEAVEEKVSLSDRFGLWLGFHPCSQETYLAMVERYAAHFGLAIDADELRREALEWAKTRGSRSGRVAWQLIQDVAGRLGVPVDRLAAGARLADAGDLRVGGVEQRDRVERLLAVAQLEVQLRRADVAGAADRGDPLAALDPLADRAPGGRGCGRRRS